MSADSDLDVLRARSDVVAALRAGASRKPALEEALDVSRSTIDRAIRDLEGAGLVTRRDGRYEPTLYCEVLFERYRQFRTEADDVAAAGPLLDHLPPDVPLDVAFLTGASIHRSTPPAPHQPVSRFERLLEGATEMRGLSRVISQSTTPRVIRERVLEGMEGELVVGSALAEYLVAERRERERELIETGRFRLFEVESLPYGLFVLDGDDGQRAVLFVYDETNDLLGTVVNDDDDAVAWAEGVYERYRSEAVDIADRFRPD